MVGGLVGGVFLVFMVMVAPGLVLEPPITLLMGWWPSAVRMCKAWHPHQTGVVWFLLAAIVLVAGTQAFLQWLATRWNGKPAGAAAPRWRWRWTLGGFGIIFCSLAAICSLVLTTHQFYWISKSSDGLFASSSRPGFETHATARGLQRIADEVEWDSLKTREAFWRGGWTAPGQSAWEETQPVWIEQDGHRLRAVVLIPRRPLRRDWAQIAVLQPATDVTLHELGELPQVLGAFGIGDAAKGSTGKTALRP
jgi:hypothetical protein